MPVTVADDGSHSRVVYPPLDRLKPVAEAVWIVDGGPLRAAAVEIPVRMTVVKLRSGELWLHSPTPYAPDLHAEIKRIGRIGHLIAPNTAHWTFLRDWQSQCPDATAWAAPGLRERAQVRRSGVRFDHDLGHEAPDAWARDFDQLVISGGFGLREVAFFHRASRTLVLTDLIENFEPAKLSPLIRSVVWAMGALAPDGKAPLHYRFAVNRNRADAKVQAGQLVAWQPERVVFAHGRWFEKDGSARLKRSLRWLLD